MKLLCQQIMQGIILCLGKGKITKIDIKTTFVPSQSLSIRPSVNDKILLACPDQPKNLKTSSRGVTPLDPSSHPLTFVFSSDSVQTYLSKTAVRTEIACIIQKIQPFLDFRRKKEEESCTNIFFKYR
jgi:hypothetical protein